MSRPITKEDIGNVCLLKHVSGQLTEYTVWDFVEEDNCVKLSDHTAYHTIYNPYDIGTWYNADGFSVIKTIKKKQQIKCIKVTEPTKQEPKSTTIWERFSTWWMDNF